MSIHGAAVVGVARFRVAVLAQIRQEAQRAGREECCGALIRGADAVIERIVPLPNEAAEPRTGYAIPPRSLFELERTMPVAGFYHSHPDGTSIPSRHDIELAWPGYIYVIAGRAMRAWRLNADATGFDEVSLALVP